ncbi:MAG TPA: 50S ribosomal protein L32 [Actinomycetota bacterium]|nr:50S ribosomal protein L32 [Actinomycetota bacterium]
MPTPKRRKTKARRDERRAHWKRVDPAPSSTCSQCQKPKLPHRVCPHCGTYGGRQVLELD